MVDVIKKATREGFGSGLVKLGEKYDDFLVMDADLAAATKSGMFKKAFPDRFYNAGIAEQNMIGIAAGIAATGKKVFASSFAMFAAGRAFEQIRNSVGYPHLNVKICATHAGISVGEDGATHQCNEDIAILRTIPGMVIINPADAVEAEKAMEAMYEYEGPAYARFGRLAVPVIFDDDYKFEIGKSVTLKEGNDITIIATGLMEGVLPFDINLHNPEAPYDPENPNGIHKYTVVIWLEGDDPECTDALIGGSIGMNFKIQFLDEVTEEEEGEGEKSGEGEENT